MLKIETWDNIERLYNSFDHYDLLKVKIPVVALLVFFVTLYLVSIEDTVTIAQQNGECPAGQVPVYEGGVQLMNQTTGMPICTPLGQLDPLGNIFGR